MAGCWYALTDRLAGRSLCAWHIGANPRVTRTFEEYLRGAPSTALWVDVPQSSRDAGTLGFMDAVRAQFVEIAASTQERQNLGLDTEKIQATPLAAQAGRFLDEKLRAGDVDEIDTVRDQREVARGGVAAFESAQALRDVAHRTKEKRTVELDHPQLGAMIEVTCIGESALRQQSVWQLLFEVRS